MKSIYYLASLLFAPAAADVESYLSSNCMYCKMMDTRAGFLYSYGFCPDDTIMETEERCIPDSWDYIAKNMKCLSDIKPGW